MNIWLQRIKDLIWLIIPSALLTVAAFWFAFQFVEPAPPNSATIATGGTSGGYFAFGNQYAQELRKAGIELQVVSTKGSVENLSLLNDDKPKVDLALLQGGIADNGGYEDLISLGRIFLEPIWLFHNLEQEIDQIHDLENKRIAVGVIGSGTRKLSLDLLRANNVTEQNATFEPLSGNKAVDALVAGEIDALFLVTSPKSKLIQRLFSHTGIQLMSFSQAEAYTRIFPYLSRVSLPRGVLDLSKDIPGRNIDMIAATAALVARRDLHPTLIGLMAQAAQKTHGGGGLFQNINEFPKPFDPELTMSEDAARTYQSGPPFLQRFLPFWLASFLERSFILLLPVLTVLIPVIKGVPWLYNWRIRNRILFWYSELKSLERQIFEDQANGAQSMKYTEEIDRIERAVGRIPIPIGFSDQFYDLRAAIDLVRQKLAEQA